MDEGPYRTQDDLPKRVDDLTKRIERLEFDSTARADQATGLVHEFRAQKRSNILSAIKWLCMAPTLAVFWWGVNLADRGCAAQQTTQAAATVRDGERYCGAVGLRYAGVTPLAGSSYATTVCGNGHGDGMYVGLDGHLHALRVPAP